MSSHPDVRPTVDPDDLTGSLIARRYHLDAKIGDGAGGAVYRATHQLMHRTVAIKVLHRDLIGDRELVERFQREARAAAAIDHPNVCATTDIDRTDDGLIFIVMEHLEGRTLGQRLAEGQTVPVAEAVELVRQIAAGLERAHALHIVHRDLKPDNIFLVEKPDEPVLVKILDFGLARVRLGDDTAALTRPGVAAGTPLYFSPEQCVGNDIDTRSDLYTLGVVFYQMLAGRPPFDSPSLATVISQHAAEPPPPLRTVAGQPVPASVEDIVMRLLAKDPAERYPTAAALTSALDGADLTAAPHSGPPDDAGSVDRAASSPGMLFRNSDGTGVPEPTASEPEGDATGAPAPLFAQKPALPATPVRDAAARRSRWTLRRVTPLKRKESLSDAARRWSTDRRVRAVAALVAVVLSVVVLVVLLSGEEDKEPDSAERTESQATAADEAAEAPAPDPTPALDAAIAEMRGEPRVRAALEQLESGDGKAGLASLERLHDALGTQPAFLLLLGQAQLEQRKTRPAMKTFQALTEAAPEYARLPALVAVLVERAIDHDDELARAILTTHMTPSLAEQLAIRAMQGPIGSALPQRRRIKRLLDESGAYKRLEGWIQLCVELRLNDRNGCFSRKPLVEEMRTLGDPRVLPVLQLIVQDPSVKKDCMQTDLDATMAALEAARP